MMCEMNNLTEIDVLLIYMNFSLVIKAIFCYCRYGHGKTGVVGITLKPETLKTWALSRHIFSQIVESITCLRDDNDDTSQTTHKEESKGRIAADKKDRLAIKTKLETCIDPLSPDAHPECLVNVVSGALAPASVNVEKAVAIGKSQLSKFQKDLPESFNATLERKVTTMATIKKGIALGPKMLYDTELIYSRVIGLQASTREVDIKDLLSYELSPIPTSLFENSGTLRYSFL